MSRGSAGPGVALRGREAPRDGVPPIELIDGEKLIDMLAQLELGLVAVKTYEVDVGSFKEFQA